MFTRRRLLRSIAAAAALSHRLPARAPSAIQVQLPLGQLRGSLDNGAHVFKGVPFAQPPVADLRFRPPLPVKPWTGVRDAVEFAPSPIQSGHQAATSEDCLYLNVFAPSEPGPHPVFVWIYGGGNTGGSTNSPMFDATTFARDGVVCVTIAYRVGALGFLELGRVLGPEYAGSGNNGIRDQIMALRWVKQNIAGFGGDPARVIVGGQSAGAKNVAALFASPEARGLFHGAIMESGSGQTVFPLPDAERVASFFARLAPDPRRLSAAEILAAQQRLLKEYDLGFPFRPVIDGHLLPHSPVALVAAGASRKIPLLLGTNRDESASFVDELHAAQPLNQKELANTELPKLASVEESYRKAFPQLTEAQRHIRMLTAEEYWVPSIRFADAHSDAGGATYMYRFDHTPDHGPFAGKAAHASELPFVWDHLPPPSNPLAQQMHKAWISFIRSNVPGSGWPPYKAPDRQTMIFDDHSAVESNPHQQELLSWRNVL